VRERKRGAQRGKERVSERERVREREWETMRENGGRMREEGSDRKWRWRGCDTVGGSVLQCVAVCCSVLQCDAVCCSVMREQQKVESERIKGLYTALRTNFTVS